MPGQKHRLRSLWLLACLLAGCGGGGAQPVLLTAPGGSAGSGATQLTVHIDVPQTGVATSRRPAYVSASTQSIAIAVLDASGRQAGAASMNVSTTSTSCTLVTANVASSLACALTLSVNITASGSYTIATSTYDQPQTQACSVTGTPRCAGNVLSASDLATSLMLNAANTVSLVLGGLPASIAVTPVANGFFQGNTQTGLRLYGPQTQTFSVTAYDAGGNAIVGNGAPVITVASAAPTVRVTNLSPGQYSLQATTSGSPPAVTVATTALTVTATPVNSPAGPYSQTVALHVDHTAVLVSNNTSVLVFLDGNTVSSGALPQVSSPRGIAFVDGSVYVGNDVQTGYVTKCTEVASYADCAHVISGPPYITGVAADPGGNLWITSNGSNIIEYLAGQTTPNLTIATSYSTLRGISVDTNGTLWVADQGTNTVAAYTAPFHSVSTPSTVLSASNGIASPVQVSSDASANLWIANSGAGTLQFAPPITSASGAAIVLGSGNGIDAPQGVAIDAIASIWIASTGNNTVTHCLPPAGTIPCTSFGVTGATWIAAYPSDVDP